MLTTVSSFVVSSHDLRCCDEVIVRAVRKLTLIFTSKTYESKRSPCWRYLQQRICPPSHLSVAMLTGFLWSEGGPPNSRFNRCPRANSSGVKIPVGSSKGKQTSPSSGPLAASSPISTWPRAVRKPRRMDARRPSRARADEWNMELWRARQRFMYAADGGAISGGGTASGSAAATASITSPRASSACWGAMPTLALRLLPREPVRRWCPWPPLDPILWCPWLPPEAVRRWVAKVRRVLRAAKRPTAPRC
eukprot:scaffold306227_cov35-Tisochrysis_lutea.AAC.2